MRARAPIALRRVAGGLIVLAAALLGTATSAAGGVPARGALKAAADSLIARHVPGPGGGWAWRSAIQAPHLQTDRDVGAAGVAMALVAAYDTTRRTAYLDGARHAGDWLLATAQPDDGGLRWPDYHDPHAVSNTYFTSFDDGAAGIADVLWRLGAATGDARYTNAAVAGMRWLENQAIGIRGAPCAQVCRWRYYEGESDYRSGMGEGSAGIVYALDVFAERTGDAGFERRALQGGASLERLIRPNGSIPERGGGTEYDTGFLSGAAGSAFAFLRLYTHTHDPRWRRDAERLLGWVRRQARRQAHGIAWPVEIDPRDGDNADLATGIEEGAAGIGWVNLQAFATTGEQVYLRQAVAAGDWLVAVAHRERTGVSWPEDAGGKLVHTSLNNGAPGIAWFLHDLATAAKRPRYERTAQAGRKWLLSTARRDAHGTYWFEHRAAKRWGLAREPSWHWGTAGIAALLARFDGWPVDMPTEEPALTDPAG